MNDLVSIIMPSYNTGDYITDSIGSVLSQTYKNWELLIVDDCSDDETREILSRQADPRIRIINNEKRFGAAYSRNKAILNARGRWIAFLDSDDLWDTEKLEKQIAFMEKNGYTFTYTEYREIDKSGDETGVVVSGPKRIKIGGMAKYCWPGCLTVIYDKNALGLLQITEIEKNNDYAMWLELSKKSECYLLRETLASYRRGRYGSISSHSVFKMLRWHYLLFRKCESQSVFVATASMLRNVLFGVIKKVFYVSKESKQ